MKVYIVVHEDYDYWIEAVYVDEDKAQKRADLENSTTDHKMYVVDEWEVE